MTDSGRLLRFVLVGGATAVIHYGLLYAGVELLGLAAIFASSVGFAIAVTFNYFMHYSWTFAEPAPHGRTAARYLFMICCGFMINGLLMYVCSTVLAVNYLLSQAVATVAVLTWNFTVANFWVFRV
ncbi:MAG: GtrA family protein [Halioglobus sp.]